MSVQLADAVKARALELGFDLVGITGAEPSVFAAEYREWLDRGYAGEMDYLARNLDRRLNPQELLPDARSIIVVGMNYYTEEAEGDLPRAKTPRRKEERQEEREAPCPKTPRDVTERVEERTAQEAVSNQQSSEWEAAAAVGGGRQIQTPGGHPQSEIQNRAVFARYARGDDYHDVMTARLRELLGFLKAEAGEGAEGRVYVDTGPILEREVARRAGLGWFGKNTMLINTRRGSYFFLGEIVTNVALPADAPAVGGCGTCTRCIDACPTGAIIAPYVLDARRCISYLTIELKGSIPEEFCPAIAETGRIYGCDICQEVCPFNRTHLAAPYPTLFSAQEPAFQPRDVTAKSKVTDLLYMNHEEFREKFKGSPVKRAKRRGLLRNAAAALCARDDTEAIAALEHALNDPEELVRETAAWSLEQITATRQT